MDYDAEDDLYGESVPTAVENLFEAIDELDPGAVRDMLNAGESPDSIGADGCSALFAAVVNKDYATMVVLLDAGANPDLVGTDVVKLNQYGSPLNYACRHGLRAAITLLLDRGANPALTSRDLSTAAHHLFEYSRKATASTPLWFSFAGKTLSKMFAAGLSPDSKTGFDSNLLESALNGKVPLSILTALLDAGADPRQKSEDGSEFIHHASCFRPELVELLVQRGVSIDTLDGKGRTPLFYCQRVEGVAMYRALGGDIDHQDLNGNTALHNYIEHETTATLVSDRVLQLVEAGATVGLKNNEGLTAVDIARLKELTAHLPLLGSIAARQAMRRATSTLHPG
jgi:ankyrin repeat protein